MNYYYCSSFSAFIIIILLLAFSLSTTIVVASSPQQCSLSPTAPLFLALTMPTPVSLVHIHLLSMLQYREDPYIPSFLNASLNKIADYRQFLDMASNLTDSQINAKFAEWMRAQSEQIKKQYRDYDAISEKTAEQFQAIHDQNIGEHSSELKMAEKRMVAVINDPQMAAGDKIMKIMAMISTLPMDICKEFEQFWSEKLTQTFIQQTQKEH